MMFGDGAWLEQRAARQFSRLENWLRRANRPVVVELGAESYIASVRYFSDQVIHANGGRFVRINPRESMVPFSMDVGLAVGALTGISAIDALLDMAQLIALNQHRDVMLPD